MTPTILKNLRTHAVQMVPVETEMVKLTSDVMDDTEAVMALTGKCRVMYRTFAEFTFVDFGDKHQEQAMREKAIPAVMHELYGEVRHELAEVYYSLVQKGVDRDTPAMIKLADLMVTLAGDRG